MTRRPRTMASMTDFCSRVTAVGVVSRYGKICSMLFTVSAGALSGDFLCKYVLARRWYHRAWASASTYLRSGELAGMLTEAEVARAAGEAGIAPFSFVLWPLGSTAGSRIEIDAGLTLYPASMMKTPLA